MTKRKPYEIRGNGQTFAKIATLSHAGKRGVWYRALCGGQHRHSTFLVGSGLQHVEKPRSSRKLPHFLLSNQQLCKFLIWFFSLRGIWERYRLRAEAAQNRRDDGHGRVYACGQGTKETQTAQGHRRSTKETRASVRIAGSRWRQPRAQGLQTSAKAVSPQTSSGTRNKDYTAKKCNNAKKNNPEKSRE